MSKKEKAIKQISQEDIKYLIESELKKENPDYELISRLSAKNSITVETTTTAKADKKSLKPFSWAKSGFKSLSASLKKEFVIATLLYAIYTGLWSLQNMRPFGDSDRKVFSLNNPDENIIYSIFLGIFAYILVSIAYGYFLLSIELRNSGKDKLLNKKRILSLLGISVLFDLPFLFIDLNIIKTPMIWFYFNVAIISATLKTYAYSLLFEVPGKPKQSRLIQRVIGAHSRMVDLNFINILIAILLGIIISIVSELVGIYDIDAEDFLSSFLQPTLMAIATSFLFLSFFSFDKAQYKQPGFFLRVLYVAIMMFVSFVLAPIAVIFLTIHTAFGFTKIFEASYFENPTVGLSQVYFGVTVAILLAFYTLNTLKYSKEKYASLKEWFNKLMPFHVAYSLLGLFFASIGLTIRISKHGLTNNRIFAVIVILIEVLFLAYTLKNLVNFKARKFTFKTKYNNRSFAALVLIPFVIITLGNFIYTVVDIDGRKVKKQLREVSNTSEFKLFNYDTELNPSDTIYQSMSENLSSKYLINYPTTPTPSQLNPYLKDTPQISQLFVMINFTYSGENSLNDYAISNEVKAVLEMVNSSKFEAKECNEKYVKILSEKGFSAKAMEKPISSWYFSQYAKDQREFNNLIRCIGISKSYYDYRF